MLDITWTTTMVLPCVLRWWGGPLLDQLVYEALLIYGWIDFVAVKDVGVDFGDVEEMGEEPLVPLLRLQYQFIIG